MPDYKKVHYRINVKDVSNELDRLSAGPDLPTILKFESILETLFQETQHHVHVITESLKLSGRRWSDHPRSRWRGRITYGGASTGINNPVKYALFEQERDADHDFMRSLYDADPLWEGPIRDFMDGHQ